MMDSDEALFERLVQGDMCAFDRLYDRFERPLFGFIRAQISDAGEAEDVMQEAFIAVLRERRARSGMRSFRAWLYQVTRNICLNRARSRKRKDHAIEEVKNVRDSEPPIADKVMEHVQLAQLLQNAVARLPQSLAEVYRLRAAGMSYEEVADVLDVPVGTVKSRIHDMIKRLREEVSR